MRYRSAYNSGLALALWDCDDDVRTVGDGAGRLQDLALDDPRVLRRLQAEMIYRGVNVTTVSEDDCAVCRRGR